MTSPLDTLGTFVHPCLTCGQTLNTLNGETPPHDCNPNTGAIIARAWWAGWDAAKAHAQQEANAVAQHVIDHVHAWNREGIDAGVVNLAEAAFSGDCND